MNGIGLDCGNATLKLVLLSPEGKFLWEKTASHYGAVVQSARLLLGELLAADPGACGCPVVITGSAVDRPKERCDALAVLGEIPAIHLGVRLLVPEARSVIEIGSQSARFLTGLDQNTPPRFAVSEHCAGGTGSFFEDQMSRLGLKLEDYSRLVGQARSSPGSPAAARSSPKRTSSTGSRRGCPHRTSSWAFATPWCATTRR